MRTQIKQRASAALFFIQSPAHGSIWIDIAGVQIRCSETHNLTQESLIYQLPGSHDRGYEPVLESHLMRRVSLVSRIDDLPRFRQIHSKRLVTVYVLPGVQSVDQQVFMQVIRRAAVYDMYIVSFKELMIIGCAKLISTVFSGALCSFRS